MINCVNTTDLSIHSVDGHLGCFCSLTNMNGTFLDMSFGGHMHSSLWNVSVGLGSLCHRAALLSLSLLDAYCQAGLAIGV